MDKKNSTVHHIPNLLNRFKNLLDLLISTNDVLKRCIINGEKLCIRCNYVYQVDKLQNESLIRPY